MRAWTVLGGLVGVLLAVPAATAGDHYYQKQCGIMIFKSRVPAAGGYNAPGYSAPPYSAPPMYSAPPSYGCSGGYAAPPYSAPPSGCYGGGYHAAPYSAAPYSAAPYSAAPYGGYAPQAGLADFFTSFALQQLCGRLPGGTSAAGLGDMPDRLKRVETDVADIKTTVGKAATATSLKALDDAVSGVAGQVGKLQKDVTALKVVDAATLQEKLDGLERRLGGKIDDAKAKAVDAATLEQKLKELEARIKK